jgi:hypothetical protein
MLTLNEARAGGCLIEKQIGHSLLHVCQLNGHEYSRSDWLRGNMGIDPTLASRVTAGLRLKWTPRSVDSRSCSSRSSRARRSARAAECRLLFQLCGHAARFLGLLAKSRS